MSAGTKGSGAGRIGTPSGVFRLRCRPQYSYWIIGSALLIYVGLCTGQRDNHWTTDAWEHHRAVLALTEDLFAPKNPTYAADEPSVRYSPYSVALAVISQLTHRDPYQILSVAAVVNLLCLLGALRILLGTFQEEKVSTYALVMLIGLWIQGPGNAQSTALSDLPWHQVNPSAFSFWIALLVWILVRQISRERLSVGWLALCTILLATIFLTHAIVGAICVLGMGMLILFGPTDRRRILLWTAPACLVGAVALCLLWPWYDFHVILAGKKAEGSWFHPQVLWKTLTVWYFPSILFAIFALPLRNRPLVAFCLTGALVCYSLGWVSFVTRSFAMQRVSFGGLFFAHVAVAVWAAERGVFRWTTWGRRLRLLFSQDLRTACQAAVELCLVIMIAWGLASQGWTIMREPHLARSYIAPFLGKENKQLDLRSRFKRLLAPIEQHDVVLSDTATSWPIPSFGARIVCSLHGEFGYYFDEATRCKDVRDFFSATTDDEKRKRIIQRYDVRWILLNREQLAHGVFDNLAEPSAIVTDIGPFLLMNAGTWRLTRQR